MADIEFAATRDGKSCGFSQPRYGAGQLVLGPKELLRRSSFEREEEEKRNPKITTKTILKHLKTTYV